MIEAPPLTGIHVVSTRPREHADGFEARVRALGGVPTVAPAIAIGEPRSWAPVDEALRRLDDYAWIAFTSGNAGRALLDRLEAQGIGPGRGRPRLAAIGPATAATLVARGWRPNLVASGHRAEAFAHAFPLLAGERILFPHGDLARDTLPTLLRRRGARVDEVVAYRTLPGEGIPAIVGLLRADAADALLFASPSAVDFLATALLAIGLSPKALSRNDRPAVFCVGPSTGEAASAAGFRPAGIAPIASDEALLAEAARWFGARASRAE